MAKEATQSSPADYIQQLNPKGYVNNREITNLPGHFLVKGSQNCFIVNKEKVVSTKGYTLVGAAKTKNKGHRSSYDWTTSSNLSRSLRMNDDGELEVYYGGSWLLIDTYAKNSLANFTTWWSTTELLDLLLFVVGTADVHTWSGGIAEIASATATTLTMKGYLAGTTVAFVEGGASPDTITDSANGFVTAGFEAGDTIIISGSASNDGTYTIETVAAGTLTLSNDDDLTAESAGATVVAKKPNATWGESRFLTAGTRKVTVNGVEYPYTGGETTGTLTGLADITGVGAGDIAIQTVRTESPSGLTGFQTDLIGMMNNYVFYGSKTSRHYFVSKSTDFTVFIHTALRKPTEGFEGDLDSTPTAFVPDEDFMWISGHKDDWYKILFVLSSDQASESLQVRKLKTATGQGAQSQGVIVNIKNAVAFLSFEPTIDTLGRVLNIDTPTSVPISNDIRDDLLSYNLAGAHGIFYQNQIFMTLPAEGVLIIYNNQDQIWQPPRIIALGRLALIDLDGNGTQVLCGHSSVCNETYRLFNGYDENGSTCKVVMAFGYDNFGTRFTQKGADEFASELYMSENTIVEDKVVYDYKGATDTRAFEIDGSDTTIQFKPVAGGGFGENPHGADPLGSLATPIDDLSKIRVVNMTSPLDFFERQRIYSSESINARFAVIAYGENVEVSDNIPTFIKR